MVVAVARRTRAGKAAKAVIAAAFIMELPVSQAPSVSAATAAATRPRILAAVAAAAVAADITAAAGAAPDPKARAGSAVVVVVVADRHTLNPERLTSKTKKEKRLPVMAKSSFRGKGNYNNEGFNV